MDPSLSLFCLLLQRFQPDYHSFYDTSTQPGASSRALAAGKSISVPFGVRQKTVYGSRALVRDLINILNGINDQRSHSFPASEESYLNLEKHVVRRRI